MTVKEAGEQIKEKVPNDCHLKTISQNHQIFDMHILGTYTKFTPNMKFLCLAMWLGGCTKMTVTPTCEDW